MLRKVMLVTPVLLLACAVAHAEDAKPKFYDPETHKEIDGPRIYDANHNVIEVKKNPGQKVPEHLVKLMKSGKADPAAPNHIFKVAAAPMQFISLKQYEDCKVFKRPDGKPY